MYDLMMDIKGVGWAVTIQRIERLMEAKQPPWSRAELAREANVDRSLISNILNGNKEPTAISLEKIAKALDTTVEYLRGTTENPRLASAEPLPEYALEVIDSMLKLDRVHRYELMVIARSFVAASDNVDEMRIEEFIKLAIDLAEESHGELATDQVMSFLEELQKRMKGSSGRGLLGGNGPEQPS